MQFGSNIGKSKIIWLTVAALILAIGGFYLWSRVSSQDIAINAKVSSGEVVVGMPLAITVDFANNSNNDLIKATLSLDLPDSVRLADGGKRAVETRSIGDVKRGAVHQEVFQLVPLPSANGAKRTFNITASYAIGSTTARFDKIVTISVEVGNLPLTLELGAPDKVFSGEEFESTAAYGRDNSNLSDLNNLPPLSLRLDYPDTFSPTSSNPQATGTAGNIWPVTTLKPGDVGKALVRGKINLPDQSSFNMTADLLANIFGTDYVVLSKSVQIAVSPSPLSFNVSVGDGSRSVFNPGETLNYTLSYKNNTQVALQGIVITAKLAGEMLDLNSLKLNGARFSSIGNVITWDSVNNQDLASLPAGASGNVNFNVSLKGSYPIRRLNDKNFSVKVSSKIESPTVPYLIQADSTVNTSVLVIKIAGRIALVANGYFRDASSGLLNSGPWPPKVGSPTNFTVHWKLTNYSTDATGVEVRAKLADNVKFTGQAKANTTAVPQFDSSTGEMVWSVGQLSATSGILTDAPEAIFQLEAVPQASDTGKYMNLLLPSGVKAQDNFTGQNLTAGSDVVSTSLPSDSTVNPNDGLVVN